jgi:hypothetical protein
LQRCGRVDAAVTHSAENAGIMPVEPGRPTAVLPGWFSGLTVQDDSDADDRVSLEQLQQLLAWAQSSDVLGRVREVRQRNSIAQSAARVAIRQAQPAPAPVGGPRILSSDIVGQPTDSVEESLANRGVTIRREPFEPRIGIGAVRDAAGLCLGGRGPPRRARQRAGAGVGHPARPAAATPPAAPHRPVGLSRCDG